MIQRPLLLKQILDALSWSRVVSLTGPRQCGKTTIARQIVPYDSPAYFDLEDYRHVQRLENPMEALARLEGIVIIDEIHRRPELFPVLRVLADRDPLPAKFLVLGSSSFALQKQASESLAGRIARIEMRGFSLSELGTTSMHRHWLRGSFPRSYLAENDEVSDAWRREFLHTFLERDVPQFGFAIPASTLGRFWAMVAHSHGQIWNGAQLSQSLGVSQPSVRRYLDLLTDLYMIRQLPAYHANIKKRQVRSPKILFRDSGMLHHMLGIRTERDLYMHPKYGASWEGYAIEEVLAIAEPDEAYYWAAQREGEIDLVLRKNGRTIGVECKCADAPSLTPSLQIASRDLELDRIVVVYPGEQRYSLADGIDVVPLAQVVGREMGQEPFALFGSAIV